MRIRPCVFVTTFVQYNMMNSFEKNYYICSYIQLSTVHAYLEIPTFEMVYLYYNITV